MERTEIETNWMEPRDSEAQNLLAAREQNEKINQRVTDFKHSFESPNGKRTLGHLSEFCFEKDMTFVENSDISAFREGKRAVILEIRHWLDFDLNKLKE